MSARTARISENYRRLPISYKQARLSQKNIAIINFQETIKIIGSVILSQTGFLFISSMQ